HNLTRMDRRTLHRALHGILSHPFTSMILFKIDPQRITIFPHCSKTTGTPQRLSLSRLNHWLPRGQAHPEVVQGTAQFHHPITDAFFPQADAVFHNATALHSTVDMLDPQPPLVKRPVRRLLLSCELLAAWLLGRHENYHPRERERQEPQILQE